MILSQQIDNPGDTRLSCWLSAGSVQARVRPSDWPAVMPRILSRNLPSARSPLHLYPCFEADRSRPPLRPNILGLTPRQNPHRARCTVAPHRPRFRALALFGRRPPQRVDSLIIAGVRKPAQERPHALQ